MEFIQIGLSSKETKIACSGSFMRSLPEIVNSEGEDILLKYYKDKYSQEELINILFPKDGAGHSLTRKNLTLLMWLWLKKFKRGDRFF